MRIVLLIAGLIVGAAAAEVYRWVDEDGSVHYSDRPHAGAETVTLPSAQTFKAPVVNRRRPAGTVEEEPQPAVQYQLVEIVRPVQEEVLWNTGGQIDVAVRVTPKVQSGHSLLLYLDGQRVDAVASGGVQFTLTDVVRGQHELRAEVHGAAGVKLIESRTVAFTVQQTSLLNPNNPNPGRL